MRKDGETEEERRRIAHTTRVAQFRSSKHCTYCAEAGQPEEFGSVRRCAFPDGTFVVNNWQCALLLEISARSETRLYGDDETLTALSVPCLDDFGARTTFGWIVLTRYKSRGETSSAVHVGDFFPPTVLTFEVADRAIRLLTGRVTT